VDVRSVLTREFGSALTFEEFFRTEYPRLRGAMYLITGRSEEAEELAQEAMARVFERWDRIGSLESPGGYVYRTALNLNRQRLRHLAVRARRLLALARMSERERDPEMEVDLSLALEALPRGQREALILVEWVGLTSEETAGVLGIEASSVRSRIHRARAAVRQRLEEPSE
jgi:RNA polymerase sigma factor (sigma-70 family)